MRLAVAVCVAGLAAVASAGIQPWSLVRLDLDVRITTEPPHVTVTGRALVRAEAESDGPTFRINSRAKVMALQRLTGGGATASIHPFAAGSPIEVADLKFRRPFRKGETLEVEFTAESAEDSSQFVVGSNAVLASWVEGWYPLPATSARSLAPPHAPGTTTFLLPRGWHSVANGRRIGPEAWQADQPAARSFVAAPFAVADEIDVEGRKIGTFLLKARPALRAQAVALGNAVAAMERRFGPYPYPSFHIVEVPQSVSFAAASEQGFIMVRSSVLDAEQGNLPLFGHEAAHAWWGNLVRTEGPGGKMLSEAAAQFGAVISIEAVEGEAAARRFLRYSRAGYNPLQCALGYFYVWREGGDKPLAKLASDRWDHTLADAKGHWFYHMVRHRLGDERFFTALRSIISQFSGKEATVDDLRRALLAVSDDRELGRFLDQWLDGTGAPVLGMEWWSADRGRGVEIIIEQRQSEEPFQLPLEIAVVTDSGQTVVTTVQLCDRRERFFIATPSRPVRVDLDPNDRMLLWRPEYGPPF